MFSATEFASALPYGGARANLFKIEIPTAGILDTNGGTGVDRLITLNAKTTSIPPSTIEPVEVPFGGRTFRLPGGRTFDDWGVTITNDEDFKVRDFFEQWNNAMNSHSHNLSSNEMTNQASYSVDAKVIQFAKNGVPIRQYVMKGAWPHTIGETSLDWAENGSIQEFEVTFAFNWWDSAATTSLENIGRYAFTNHGSTNPDPFLG